MFRFVLTGAYGFLVKSHVVTVYCHWSFGVVLPVYRILSPFRLISLHLEPMVYTQKPEFTPPTERRLANVYIADLCVRLHLLMNIVLKEQQGLQSVPKVGFFKRVSQRKKVLGHSPPCFLGKGQEPFRNVEAPSG